MNASGSRRPGRMKAPGEHGEALVIPPFDQVASLIANNTSTRESVDFDIQGRSYSSLVTQAREDLITMATQYTRSYRDVADPPQTQPHDTPILLSGHQPELFHPGVWFKHFALSLLGRQHAAWAINLVVDNDLCRRPAIRVPGGSTSSPTVRWIDFDRSVEAATWERRTIADRDRLASFGRRVREEIGSLAGHPMIEPFWPLVVARAEQTDNLGSCLSQARHQFERQLGLETLELPVSQMCRMESFIRFTAYLLANLPRVRRVYNESLAEYRRANHIRSSSHPVPELAEDSTWLEAPFWILKGASPRRGRLFVMTSGDRMILSDRQSIRFELPLLSESDGEIAVESLRETALQGIRLRPRALLTTMFARLFLSDLFLHGIGGAKYDQLTDRLIARIFNVSPPQYLTLTATFRLPIAASQTPSSRDARTIKRQLRDLRYNPDRFLSAPARMEDNSEQTAALIARKQQWIASSAGSGLDRRANYEYVCHRHQEIESANLLLQPPVADERRRLEQQLDYVTVQSQANAILSSREYSFCLFSSNTLPELLRALSQT